MVDYLNNEAKFLLHAIAHIYFVRSELWVNTAIRDRVYYDTWNGMNVVSEGYSNCIS